MKLCECGCGQPAPIAKENRPNRGLIKGQPQRFIHGHQNRARHGSEESRFLLRIEACRTDGCWIWDRSLQGDGYGYFHRTNGGSTYAHIVSWERVNGPVPEGMELDHLCREPRCFNPEHLEAVSHQVNVLRGVGVAARRATQTHCVAGHEFTEENTYILSGYRNCRTCHKRRSREWWERKRSQLTKEGNSSCRTN